MYRNARAWLVTCSVVVLAFASYSASTPAQPVRAVDTAPLTANLAPGALKQAAPRRTAATVQTSPAYRSPGDVIDATATRTPTPINVGNFVWDDLNANGRQDAGEPGLAGVTVQLWNSTKTALLDQTTTNSSGLYSLTAPLPGDYRVRVLLPGVGDEFSPKDQAGGNDQLDSDINPTGINTGFTDVFTLASNVISTTIHDAGIIIFRTATPTRTPTPINVGNFVWHDLNANGAQDAGEPGVGGVTVQLWNSTKTALLDQTTTNSSGLYSLTAPLPGDYRVRVLLPTGASFTTKDQAGGNDQLDSDINPTGTDFGFTNVYTFASNLISITTIDAGLLNVQPSPTPTITNTSTATATMTRTPTATTPPVLSRRAYLPIVEQ